MQDQSRNMKVQCYTVQPFCSLQSAPELTDDHVSISSTSENEDLSEQHSMVSVDLVCQSTNFSGF